MKPCSIIDAMNSRRLFGPLFPGETWDAWRAFLSALYALPMDDRQLAIYRQCTGRIDAPVQPLKEATLICGRRGGKSRVLALLAAFIGCFIDHQPCLSAGEVATVAVIAADRRQARTVLRYIVGLLRAVPALESLIEGETAESISLSNRVQIEVQTASFRLARGLTMAAVLADEAAFWTVDEGSANPDIEIIRAVRPALATLPHSLLLIASSPYAKRGVLWQNYQRYFGRENGRILVWQAETAVMNPALDPALIAQAYDEDPEAARAEYGGQFRGDVAQFVQPEVVDACTITGRTELPAIGGVQYVGCVDPSGGSADSMTLAIAHAEGNTAVLDLVREARPPFSPESVVSEFAEILRIYRITNVIGDRYAGEFVREPFRKHGIGYELSSKPVSDIYRDFLPVLNSGRVKLLDLPRLTTQLIGLERRTARNGKDSISHAPRGHDDVANAAAGATLLAVSEANTAAVWSDAAIRGLEALANFSFWS